MAIVFNKELNEDIIALAFNNNIVEFYSDTAGIPANAIIGINEYQLTIYPSPNGIFRYNFKELIISMINKNNYQDLINPNLETSYIYDWTNDVYLESEITIVINFTSGVSFIDTKTIHWLSGYVNLKNWKTQYPNETLQAGKIQLLQAKNSNAYYNYHSKYWIGYPFDIPIYNNKTNLSFFNNTNGLESDFLANDNYISRMVFSDGRTDVSIEDHLEFVNGINDLVIYNESNEFNVNIYKETSHCPNGVYIKWMNSLGGFNYWLFPKGQENLKTKGRGTLENDFNNLEDTTSPYISLGKESNTSIKVKQKRIKSVYKILLESLMDSAKVYLFTGVPYSKNTFNDWVEVEVKDGTFTTENPKSDLYDFTFEFGIPKNVTRSL